MWPHCGSASRGEMGQACGLSLRGDLQERNGGSRGREEVSL